MIQSYIKMWKNCLNLQGRTRRDQYWEAMLCNVFIVVLLFILNISFGGIGEYIQSVYQLVILIPIFSASVRRCHDVDKSGWFILWNILPFVGNIIFVYAAMTRSTNVPNKYGDSPYAAHELQAI